MKLNFLGNDGWTSNHNLKGHNEAACGIVTVLEVQGEYVEVRVTFSRKWLMNVNKKFSFRILVNGDFMMYVETGSTNKTV
jgi:hypothetical protein